jgi:hypothetical protein
MNAMRWRWVFLFPALVVLVGCGKSTGTLAGKVTLNGEALSYGQLSVFNDKSEILGIATILNGEYKLADLPLGPAIVVVQSVGPDGQAIGVVSRPPPPKDAKAPPPDLTKELKKDLPEGIKTALEDLKPVPLKYTNVKQTDLKVTVVKGDTPFDVAMTGKGEIPKGPPTPTPGGAPPPGAPGGPPLPPGVPGGPPLPPGAPGGPPR